MITAIKTQYAAMPFGSKEMESEIAEMPFGSSAMPFDYHEI